MYSVGIFCKKCGSKLEVVDEFKEGTKKDWFVNPCGSCMTRNAEIPLERKTDTTAASCEDYCSYRNTEKCNNCAWKWKGTPRTPRS